ncbi:glucose-6-Phosphatase [Anticarsia gemmatalis]|uniref:glucose-6-Phosphatase n=1 Tax=Anticarsia gemmatalis TaxID=129554 RepID=UPI003F75901C
MEQIYALGIVCIEFVQEWFSDFEWYFELVNNISNPHYVTEIMFPVMCTFDSVFATQLLLCMAFGGWLNCIMKWWLQEERPYWWVRETTYYGESERPVLMQTWQTCETGPGSPSGHSTAAAMLILLMLMWIKHIMHDRKCYIWWWTWVLYPVSAIALCSVMLARMYVATHFPHQVLFGAFVGSFLAPALCIYISDPFIWRYGAGSVRRAQGWHALGAALAAALSVLAYYLLLLTGHDPQWTIKLAFRWCQSPEEINVCSTPIFALVQSTASLLGLALSVTPIVAEYRHDTKNRSLVICGACVAGVVYGMKYVIDNMCKASALHFYATHFVLAAFKPMLLLRLAPALAMWPFQPSKPKVE